MLQGPVDGQNPFRTTLPPWEAVAVGIYRGILSFQGFLGGAKWMQNGFRPSTVGCVLTLEESSLECPSSAAIRRPDPDGDCFCGQKLCRSEFERPMAPLVQQNPLVLLKASSPPKAPLQIMVRCGFSHGSSLHQSLVSQRPHVLETMSHRDKHGSSWAVISSPVQSEMR